MSGPHRHKKVQIRKSRAKKMHASICKHSPALAHQNPFYYRSLCCRLPPRLVLECEFVASGNVMRSSPEPTAVGCHERTSMLEVFVHPIAITHYPRPSPLHRPIVVRPEIPSPPTLPPLPLVTVGNGPTTPSSTADHVFFTAGSAGGKKMAKKIRYRCRPTRCRRKC